MPRRDGVDSRNISPSSCIRRLLSIRYTKDIKYVCMRLDIPSKGTKGELIDRIVDQTTNSRDYTDLIDFIAQLPCLKGKGDQATNKQIMAKSGVEVHPPMECPFLNCVCGDTAVSSELIWCVSCGRILHVKCTFGDSTKIRALGDKWRVSMYASIRNIPGYIAEHSRENVDLHDMLRKISQDLPNPIPEWNGKESEQFWSAPLPFHSEDGVRKCFIVMCPECTVACMDPAMPIFRIIGSSTSLFQPLYQALPPNMNVDFDAKMSRMGASQSDAIAFKNTFYHGSPQLLWCTTIPSTSQGPDKLVINANIKNAFFTLPREWLELRRNDREVNMRCVKVEESGGPLPMINEWPRAVTYTINGQQGCIKPPEPNTPRRDRPLDISELSAVGRNTLDIKLEIQSEPHTDNGTRITPRYIFAIVLVSPVKLGRLGSYMVYSSLMADQFLNTSLTSVKAQEMHIRRSYYTELNPISHLYADFETKWLSQLLDPHFNQESRVDVGVELVTTIRPAVLVNRDPSSWERIKIPVRGLYCQHVQVFDLMTYVEVIKRSNLVANRWKCPICDAVVTLLDIRVDPYILELFSQNPKTSKYDVSIESGEIKILRHESDDGMRAELAEEEAAIKKSNNVNVDLDDHDDKYGAEILIISDSD